MERDDYLIKKKIYKYMVTGVMTTIALQLGNVVDAMIVGNLLGSIGNGAVSTSTPYLYTLQAAAILLGSGGAVALAILLGRRDTVGAGKVMGFCVLGSIIYPLIFTALSPALIPTFVRISGVAGELETMVVKIVTVYSFGMPVISVVLVMAYLINIDNHPGMATKIHITSNAVNLILDYILVKYTPLGITGAALSTVLGYLVAGCIFFPMYIRSKNRMVSPVFKGMLSDRSAIMLSIKSGFPNLAYTIMTVISVGVINTSVLKSLGSAYFSAYAVANNTQLIVQMFLNGVSSVIASVAGVLYGEKDFVGMRRVFSRILKIGLLIGAVIMAIFLAFPQILAAMYGFDDPVIRPELLTGLRIFSLSFMIFTLNALTQNYYRTTGRTFLSTANSAMQLLVFKIPFILISLSLFGFDGLFAAIICSELTAFIVINLIRIIGQALGRIPRVGFMAIPVKNEGEILNFTIRGSDSRAVKVSEKIIEYCRRENISEEKALAMGIAAEEIVSNIGRYGYPGSDKKYIDICLSKTEDKYYLRFRDDGVPFDPVAYQPPDDDKSISGLELIKKLAVGMKYVRAISLNNTIIELE